MLASLLNTNRAALGLLLILVFAALIVGISVVVYEISHTF